MAAVVPKQEIVLKLMKIINIRSQTNPIILEYKNFPPGDNQKIWINEMKVLDLKFKLLNVKVDERVPLVSQVDEHKWYLTKDKYAIYYVMLVHENFEEKFVFKMQTKVMMLIDLYYSEISEEASSKLVTEQIRDIVDGFNNALSKGANPEQLIPSGVEESVREIDKPEVDMNAQLVESIDEREYHFLVDKRNGKLLAVQIAGIGALLLALVVFVLELMADKPKML